MSLTPQQQKVIDTIQRPDVSLVKVEAVAGSGKTHTLIEIANVLKPVTGVYLAYNKAIATEASEKFKGTNIVCSTLHSLAYKAVVKQYGLKVGHFGVRDVQPSTMHYKQRLQIVELLDKLLLSEYIHVPDFFKSLPYSERPDKATQRIIVNHLDKMTHGEISCSHSFYLKLYHILLSNGAITPPECDLLMLDEAGDITPITLDIFKIIKSPKKVLVGDAMQNIYSFNNTINGFVALKDDGVSIPLTQSFRVSSTIAPRIEKFCKKYVAKDIEFKGRNYEDSTIKSHAYITRYNTELIEHMFDLMVNDQAFNVTRPVDTILELPLILANLGNGKKITNVKYKVLERLRNKYETDADMQLVYRSVNEYVRKQMSKDDEIRKGFEVVFKHGPTDLNKLAAYVKRVQSPDNTLTLTTAHSAKGLEFDSVYIGNDLNEVTKEAVMEVNCADEVSAKEYAEVIRLYYVATSRAKLELRNATMLPKGTVTHR